MANCKILQMEILVRRVLFSVTDFKTVSYSIHQMRPMEPRKLINGPKNLGPSPPPPKPLMRSTHALPSRSEVLDPALAYVRVTCVCSCASIRTIISRCRSRIIIELFYMQNISGMRIKLWRVLSAKCFVV